MQASLSNSDTFIIDLAIEAERAGVPVAKLAGCADETIALAEVLQQVLADIRHKLQRRAAADGDRGRCGLPRAADDDAGTAYGALRPVGARGPSPL